MIYPNIAQTLLAHHRCAPERLLICVLPSEEEIATLSGDLTFLIRAHNKSSAPIIENFPEFKMTLGTITETSRSVPAHRLRSQYRHVITKTQPILLTTLGALATPCPSTDTFHRFFETVTTYESFTPDAFAHLCRNLGYEEEDLVDEVGTFSVRGFVIDVYSPLYLHPLRFEFCDDHVDHIHTFNLHTQHRIELIETATLLAPRFFHWHKRPDAANLEGNLSKVPLPINQKYRIIDALRAKQYVEESDLIELSCNPAFISPTQAFKNATHLIVNEEKCLEQFQSPLTSDLEPNYLPISRSPHAEKFGSRPDSVLQAISATPIEHTSLHSQTSCIPLSSKSESPEKTLNTWIPKWLESNNRILFSYQSHHHPQKIKQHLSEQQQSQIELTTSKLSCSFIDETSGLAGIRTRDLFSSGGYAADSHHQKQLKHFFSTLKTLHIGDFVVHAQHGHCKYLGLTRITSDGINSEFISLEFAQGDKLFIPIYRLNLIQKYRSKEMAVSLDTLRDQKFSKRKKKAQEKITQFAHEIIEIKARRQFLKTSPFPPVPEEDLFSESFPFDETEDQMACITDILRDLESPVPMDRLLCGDVGFGKTEVAFRAIFRALSHGKQAALLVPTTLLAQQHFRTANERFEGQAFRIEVVSRLKSAKEQKKIIDDLKAGHVDCIIGTHRLLQKDVVYNNLGLLVIDEEQKFGVRHKEHLKRIRSNAHTLSLSATPIPRTLHQALTGIQTLSVLSTPPTSRRPIHTALTRPNDPTLKTALDREQARDGQVFCVVPRVADIPDVETWLQKTVPHIPYGIAHGQLPEVELETAMLDFYDRKFPILICTTIIESGLDVPNANTMLVFRSHMFGLSQLYQLRGRIGRGQRQAYAFLLMPKYAEIPKPTRRRMELLLRYNDLGSGFQVAHHDLEVRGAGNILGKAQSGFMHDIGDELFFDMLQKTIQRLQGQPLVEVDPELVWPWESLIPENYLPSITLRLELYQKLSSAQTESEIMDFAYDTQNRFGPVPEPLGNLISLHKMRILCQALGIQHLQLTEHSLSLTFIDNPPIQIENLMPFFQKRKLPFSFRSSSQVSLKSPFPTPDDLIKLTEQIQSETQCN